MARLYSNNFGTTLAVAINATQTSITLSSSVGLPILDPGDTYKLTIEEGPNREIIEVNDDSGSPTLICVRAQEGTVGQAFTDAAIVELRATETSFTQTGQNVGAGVGVFKEKTKTDLIFKTLIAGSNITIDENADDLTINSSGGGGGSGVTLQRQIFQIGHGFAVNDWIRLIAEDDYSLASATDAEEAEVIGVVTNVVDVDNFVVTWNGYIDTLVGLVPNTVYFLSPTAGQISAAEPNLAGQVSKPVLIAESATTGYVIQYRGEVIGAALVGTAPDTATYLTVGDESENLPNSSLGIPKPVSGEAGEHDALGYESGAYKWTSEMVEALQLPAGTTGEQPANVAGQIRFDTTDLKFRGNDGTGWTDLGGGGGASAFRDLTDISFSDYIGTDDRAQFDDVRVLSGAGSTGLFLTATTGGATNANAYAWAAGKPIIYGQSSTVYYGFSGSDHRIRNGSSDWILNSITGHTLTGNFYMQTPTAQFSAPVGTTAQRPLNSAGRQRYNTDNNAVEFNDGTSWGASYTIAGGNAIVDNNGENRLSFTGAGSATQHLNIDAQTIQGVGSNTNISVRVQPKGNQALIVQSTTNGEAGRLALREDPAVGTNSVTFSAPDDVTTSYQMTFPDTGPVGAGAGFSCLVADNNANPTFSWSGLTTDALALPAGTTAQRPASNAGRMRWNTDNTAVEVADGTDWGASYTIAQDNAIIGDTGEARLTFLGNGSDAAHLALSANALSGAGSNANVSVTLVPQGTAAVTVRTSDAVTPGRIQLEDADASNWVRLGSAPTTTGNYTITLPDTQAPNATGGVLVQDSGAANSLMNWSSASTGCLTFPGGTVAQRPGNSAGRSRYNTDYNALEISGASALWGASYTMADGNAIIDNNGENRISFSSPGNNAQYLNISEQSIEAVGNNASISVRVRPKGNGQLIIQNADVDTAGSRITLREGPVSGSNSAQIRVPDTILTTYVMRLPERDGVIGSFMAKESGGTTMLMNWTDLMTSSVLLPSGTTAQRPANQAGLMRFNSDTGNFEGNDGTGWSNFGAGGGLGDVEDDPNPALGGNLDPNGNVFGTSASNYYFGFAGGSPEIRGANANYYLTWLNDGLYYQAGTSWNNVSFRNTIDKFTITTNNLLRFKVNDNGMAVTNGPITCDQYVKAGSYTVAGVPSAATAGAGAMIYVSDESGGAVMAFSDGANWLRCTDRAVIS